jgi:hypothetical protein
MLNAIMLIVIVPCKHCKLSPFIQIHVFDDLAKIG